MASTKIVFAVGVVCAVAALVAAKPQYGGDVVQAGMPYSFEWIVNEPDYHNDFGHKEHSDGQTVEGQYYVLLPDGRRQIVTYQADHETGYHADVKYEIDQVKGKGGGYQ